MLLNENQINLLSDVIKVELFKDINTYNDSIKESEEYKSRLQETIENDPKYIIVLDAATTIEEVFSPARCFGITEILDKIKEDIETEVGKEFDLIDINWELKEEILNTLEAKLSLTSVGNFDEIKSSMIAYLKEKYKLYC